jgi:hypothetical protein
MPSTALINGIARLDGFDGFDCLAAWQLSDFDDFDCFNGPDSFD